MIKENTFQLTEPRYRSTCFLSFRKRFPSTLFTSPLVFVTLLSSRQWCKILCPTLPGWRNERRRGEIVACGDWSASSFASIHHVISRSRVFAFLTRPPDERASSSGILSDLRGFDTDDRDSIRIIRIPVFMVRSGGDFDYRQLQGWTFSRFPYR